MTRRPSWIVLGALLAALGALGGYKYWHVSKRSAQAAQFRESPIAIEAADVREIAWQPSVKSTGTVIAKRFVRLRNQLAGAVATVEFQSSQLVAQGEVLLRLDSGSQQAELESALVDIEVAEITFKRNRHLIENHLIPQFQVDSSRAALAQARARAAVLRQAIEDRLIRAPFAGRVGLRDVHPGQYLEEGTELTTLQSIDADVDVDFLLSQEIAPRLALGGDVAFSGGPLSRPASGRIVAIDVRVDQASRHVRVRAEARGLGKMLKPGAFVDVIVAAAPAQTVLVVPLAAVRRATYGDHVFVIGEPREGDSGPRVTQRFVRTGSAVEQDVIVLSGLVRTDRVAADGAFKLREGALVSIVESAEAASQVSQIPLTSARAIDRP